MNRRSALLLLLLAGCSHAEPMASGRQVENGPPPVDADRLTRNIGTDQWATWQDDATIWYSVQDSMPGVIQHDRDHCLVSIPAAGGTYTDRQCPPPANDNLTDILQQPTILDGVVAFARSDLGTFPPEHVQYRFGIWTAGLGRYAPRTLVMNFPYIAPSGVNHDAPLNLRWVRPGLLAYIGAEAGCCNKDTLRFGESIVLLDITGPTPVKSFVPDTYRASAFGVGQGGTSIYYTIYGDHRVYQRDLATGAVSVLHDFGAGRIVRDPDIVGSRMIAIIDGWHGFGDYPPFFGVAVDLGGHLIKVDLATGVETQPDPGEFFYKRPRYSPSGDRFVAEAYPLTIVPSETQVDTTVSRSADLWTFEE